MITDAALVWYGGRGGGREGGEQFADNSMHFIIPSLINSVTNKTSPSEAI